ncbi:MAG: hypothetical protein ACT4P6_03660 [Gemmatimonadaceae bacterium]
MITFTIRGVVRERETSVPLQGLFVKAYDKDLLFDDLLGGAQTDTLGRFEIVTELRDFRDLFERRPDLYFRVYRADRRTQVYSTEKAILWNAERLSNVEILIPWDRLRDPAAVSVTLLGDDDAARPEVEIGESLTLHARGLRPHTPHDIRVLVDGGDLFLSRLMTSALGDIPPTVLWPQVGLDDPHSARRFTIAEAANAWRGKSLSVRIEERGQRVAEATARIAGAFTRPLLFSSAADGRVANAIDQAKTPLHLTLHRIPDTGAARVYLVPRQYDWRIGDALAPAQLRDGSVAVREFQLSGRETSVIEFAAAGALVPGAYDIVVRPVRYGFEGDEQLQLLASDVVTRRITGLVVREDFWRAKPVLGGCVNKLPISGRTVAGAPYFRYSDTFAAGENVWGALDPGIVDPGNVGKMCALYVIPSKTAAQWNANNSLQHLPLLGGNPAAQRIKVQAGCVNANKVLLWSNATQLGEYDIVADFGNNSSDAATFVPDDQYNTPLDCIDGYFVAGFRVVNDPGTMTDYAHAGTWHYDETIVSGLGLAGTVTVEDESSHYHTPGTFTSVFRDVRLTARVFYPADAPGVTDPAQISAALPNYPVAAIVHGNGHDYTSYDTLLEHFAKNGFIAVSVDCRFLNGGFPSHGMSGLGRANVFFEHLAVLETKFGTTMQNNIGVMGHSRGGEAVLKIARLNQQQMMGKGINALISLAPTDQYGSEVLAGAWMTPYFVLYGSRDGDIDGGIWTPGYTIPQTGFALYDRASGAKKSMVFVHRATHNGFVTTNYDNPGDSPLAETSQRPFTFAYMTAFFRRYLRAEAYWDGMFNGEWVPPSVSATGAESFVQYGNTSQKLVDNFEGGVANWQTSSIGGVVSHGATLPVDPSEGRLCDHPMAAGLDPQSPHESKGLKVRWDGTGDRLTFDIPNADRDVSSWSVLSFRVTQKEASPHNAANQAQNLRVALRDSAANERAIRVSAFGTIPFPDQRSDASVRKSAFTTIRIPLTSYTIVCAGQVQVDLHNIVSLSFAFSEVSTGEIEIDDIEFTT